MVLRSCIGSADPSKVGANPFFIIICIAIFNCSICSLAISKTSSFLSVSGSASPISFRHLPGFCSQLSRIFPGRPPTAFSRCFIIRHSGKYVFLSNTLSDLLLDQMANHGILLSYGKTHIQTLPNQERSFPMKRTNQFARTERDIVNAFLTAAGSEIL